MAWTSTPTGAAMPEKTLTLDGQFVQLLSMLLEYRGAIMQRETSRNEEPPMPPNLNPDARWLSPEEEMILGVMPSDHWATTRELADKTGLPNDRDFAAILRNLCRREILESVSGRGFKLKTIDRSSPRALPDTPTS
jgi:hypothetical protein